MTESETLLAWSGPAAKPLPRLRARGQFLEQDDGTYWTAIECSDFNLYGRYIDGEDIRPILRDRAGFNLLRVWTLYDVVGIGRLIPSEHTDFYRRIPGFLSLCERYGFYVELTVFTDPRRIMPLKADQQNHLNRICEAVRAFNGI